MSGIRRTAVIVLLVLGWGALVGAAGLPLTAAVQSVGIGLGCLVSARIVQAGSPV